MTWGRDTTYLLSGLEFRYTVVVEVEVWYVHDFLSGIYGRGRVEWVHRVKYLLSIWLLGGMLAVGRI